MKKFILFLFCVATLSSCNNDDDFTDFYYETMPTESVDAPDEMLLGEEYEFTVNYIRPTSCYALYDLYYQQGEDEEETIINSEDEEEVITYHTRIVAPINIVYEENDCEQLDDLVDVSFNFVPTEEGSYRFKFFTGFDENDEETYLIVDVPVVTE